jgi:glutathionylspermidine synthase
VETLIEDVNDQSVEILCQMLHKICAHVVKRAISEGTTSSERKITGKKTLA